jgi:L-alanine-DL-glutamate epimerase-like enolase superfamily enzyme
LLGGKREKLRSYLSMTPEDDLTATRRRAKELFGMGHTAQKWFLRFGPPDGKAGFTKIVGLVEGLRTDLGEKAILMFDFAVSGRGRKDWDVDYAVRVAKAIQPFNPTWLEEPFSPEEIDCYRRLKGETDITLATGEHTYSRWNIKPFLDEKLVSYVQSDPEWCGGISELLQVCKLVSKYRNVQVIPHGHHVLAAAQTVASQPESLCPMVEYGRSWVVPRQRCQTRVVEPEAGYVQTPNEPGLGPSVDWSRCERL